MTKETARECCNILFKKTAMQYDRVLGAAVSLSARIEIVRSGHLSRSISLSLTGKPKIRNFPGTEDSCCDNFEFKDHTLSTQTLRRT